MTGRKRIDLRRMMRVLRGITMTILNIVTKVDPDGAVERFKGPASLPVWSNYRGELFIAPGIIKQ